METVILDALEMRVIGALVEKELTTPDYYPLTLNALTSACNQKSNRNPVMALEDTDVVRALDSLRREGLVMQAAEGGRVPKYAHNVEAKLHLGPRELAIICELLLRGSQTLGELRSRAERMQRFASLAEVEEVLDELMERQPPMAVKLPRQPGRKEPRYMHLLGGEEPLEAVSTEAPPEAATLQVRAEGQRIDRLEGELTALREEVEALRQELAAFREQFE